MGGGRRGGGLRRLGLDFHESTVDFGHLADQSFFPLLAFVTSQKKLFILLPPSEGKALSGATGTKFKELDDLVIARGDGTPTYNFCVVIDDWEMKVTHVIRGDDHINNTPRQINLLKALNATIHKNQSY